MMSFLLFPLLPLLLLILYIPPSILPSTPSAPSSSSSSSPSPQCPTFPFSLTLSWLYHLPSPLYSSSLLPLSPHPHLLIPSFHGDLYRIDIDGQPFSSSSYSIDTSGSNDKSKNSDSNINYFHGSPIVGMDYNDDGYDDIIWVDVNGIIYIIDGKYESNEGDEGGEGEGDRKYLAPLMYLPKFKVKKEWWKGAAGGGENENNNQRKLLQNNNLNENNMPDQLSDGLTDEAKDSLSLFSDEEGENDKNNNQNDYSEYDNYDHHSSSFDDDADYDDDFDYNNDYYHDEYNTHNPLLSPLPPTSTPLPHHIYIDPHVLSTPTLVDLNNDGFLDIVFGVSYYLDKEVILSSPSLLKTVIDDNNIKMEEIDKYYKSGGIIAIDITHHTILWNTALDMGEMSSIYTIPTVYDINKDNVIDIILGTSMGMIYVVDGNDGHVLPHYPLILSSEIQSSIVIEDINYDGEMELIGMDRGGHVMVYNTVKNTIAWEITIHGFPSQPPSLHDINNDHYIDIILGTVEGYIYALDGKDGSVMNHFPVQLGGRVISPISLLFLGEYLHPRSPLRIFSQITAQSLKNGINKENHHDPLNLSPLDPFSPLIASYIPSNSTTTSDRFSHLLSPSSISFPPPPLLVVPSFDGHLNLIDPLTGCIILMDIGEHSYGQILILDVEKRDKMVMTPLDNDGSGNGIGMDGERERIKREKEILLFLTTMNGNVLCFHIESDRKSSSAPSSSSPLLSLLSPSSFPSSSSSLSLPSPSTSVLGYMGNPYGHHHNHHVFPLVGVEMLPGTRTEGAKWIVEIYIIDGRWREKKNSHPYSYDITLHYNHILLTPVSLHYNTPGYHVITFTHPSPPSIGRLVITIVNERGQYNREEWNGYRVNIGYYREMKWLIIIPLGGMIGMMMIMMMGGGKREERGRGRRWGGEEGGIIGNEEISGGGGEKRRD